jgi:integrase
MELFKRPNSPHWQFRFTPPFGKQIQRSTKETDKKKARVIAQLAVAQIIATDPNTTRRTLSWPDACVRFVEEKTVDGKATLQDDIDKIRWFDPHLRHFDVHNITSDVIEDLILIRLAEPTKKGTVIANDTVNKYFALVSGILNRCHGPWNIPMDMPYIRRLEKPTKRVRFLTKPQFDTLIAELPPHQQAMALFGATTGLRESNVTRLQWDQVDIERKHAWVEAVRSKNDVPIAVPLSTSALKVLEAQVGSHHKYVFTYRGNPIQKAGTKAFKKALKRAGIEDFRWHDLRHTWASWHVQHGTRIEVLQELGAWKRIDMVQRYAHLSSEHLTNYVNNIEEDK